MSKARIVTGVVLLLLGLAGIVGGVVLKSQVAAGKAQLESSTELQIARAFDRKVASEYAEMQGAMALFEGGSTAAIVLGGVLCLAGVIVFATGSRRQSPPFVAQPADGGQSPPPVV